MSLNFTDFLSCDNSKTFDIYNADNINELELAVMNNDYDKLITCLSNGDVIFENTNNSRLCVREHDNTCTKFCFKSAVYYAIYMNHNIVRYIKSIVNKLNKKNTFSETLSVQLTDLYNQLLSINNDVNGCGCKKILSLKQRYCDYTSYFHNSEVVSLLNDISEQLKKLSKTDNYDINIGSFDDIYTFDCMHNDYEISSSVDLCNLFVNAHRHYEVNIKILKVLLNQQNYELFKFGILSSFNDMTTHIDTIYDDEIIDINYKSYYDNRNILLLSLYNPNNHTLVNELLDRKVTIPDNIHEILSDLIKAMSIDNFKVVLEYLHQRDIPNINEIIITIINEITDSNLKLELINLLCINHLSSINVYTVVHVLTNNLSLEILEIFYTNKKLIWDNTNIECVRLCIENLKSKELSILLRSNNNLIHGSNTFKPIFEILYKYFNDINNHGPYVELLNVLCEHKIDLEVQDSYKETPILYCVKNSMYWCTTKLIEMGADLFVKNMAGFNTLHIAIKNDDIKMIELLMNHKDVNNKYLINEFAKDQIYNPLLLALHSNISFDITQLLLKNENINLNQRDINGLGILDHIVMSKDLQITDKTKLFNIYLMKSIDLIEANKFDSKPLVVRAVEHDLFDIVILIMDKLIKNKDIDIGYSDMTTALKTNRTNNTINIVVRDNRAPNFYSLVLMYLKQHIATETQMNINKKHNKPVSKVSNLTNLYKMGNINNMQLDDIIKEKNIPSHLNQKQDNHIKQFVLIKLVYVILLMSNAFLEKSL
jgi:hypothetical protein